MKKLGISLLCCVLVLSGCFLFAGCGSELDKYDELKEILFELQANSDDLYEKVYIYGTYHRQSNGEKIESESYGYEILLQDVIILENCIWERSQHHSYELYWFYFDIISIKNSNDNIIWSR